MFINDKSTTGTSWEKEIDWKMIHSFSSTRMMLKILLITSCLGWVKCQEGQSMTLEEKTVIR